MNKWMAKEEMNYSKNVKLNLMSYFKRGCNSFVSKITAFWNKTESKKFVVRLKIYLGKRHFTCN